MNLLHPLLAWGLLAVAVPILIHLLLRQRPKPRPWAAMRWLTAAHREASRKWKLTNWLLLLLRCLVVALLALAVARPALPGLGGGAHLVVVIDRSASMGARGDEAGPLAAAQAALASAELPYARWSLVAVGAPGRAGAEGTELVASGERSAVIEALGRLSALPLPGGLDGAESAALSAAIEPGCDVLLVSDFQQDDGARALAVSTPLARRVARWAVGTPAPNRWIAAAPEAGDPRPGEGGELRLRVGGPAGPVRLGIDGAPPVRVAERIAGELRMPLPPLAAGTHSLRIALDEGGLAYDDVLDVPLRVRPPLAALVVAERGDYAGAALLADDGGLAASRIAPGAFAGVALPPGGAVLLRTPIADAQRLAAWVRGGGVLWANLDLVLAEPALAGSVPGLARGEGEEPGGAYATGEPDLDEILAAARRDRVPAVRLPPGSRILLRAGAATVVAAVPAGRGWIVVELAPLADDQAFTARGTVPLWVARSVRRLAAAAESPQVWTAGAPALEALRLTRAGVQVVVTAGERLALAPGTWMVGERAIIVLPDPDEARTGGAAPAGTSILLAEALPVRAGLDLGWWLLLAALAVAAVEMAVAAWAGRRYGG
jgi:hypothetical protein